LDFCFVFLDFCYFVFSDFCFVFSGFCYGEEFFVEVDFEKPFVYL
jgi:hypothetical protein